MSKAKVSLENVFKYIFNYHIDHHNQTSIIFQDRRSVCRNSLHVFKYFNTIRNISFLRTDGQFVDVIHTAGRWIGDEDVLVSSNNLIIAIVRNL